MKALAIDSVSSTLTVAAKNEDRMASLTVDAGIHQSEVILTMIKTVLEESKLTAEDIEFAVLCSGPGSFTGLRLAYAALKALQTAYKIPVYAFETLSTYAKEFKNFKGIVLPVLDARRDRFYISFFENGKCISGPLDIGIDEVVKNLAEEKDILAVGPGCELLKRKLSEIKPSINCICGVKNYNCSESLLQLGKEAYDNAEKGIETFDGPFYIRDEHGD